MIMGGPFRRNIGIGFGTLFLTVPASRLGGGTVLWSLERPTLLRSLLPCTLLLSLVHTDGTTRSNKQYHKLNITNRLQVTICRIGAVIYQKRALAPIPRAIDERLSAPNFHQAWCVYRISARRSWASHDHDRRAVDTFPDSFCFPSDIYHRHQMVNFLVSKVDGILAGISPGSEKHIAIQMSICRFVLEVDPRCYLLHVWNYMPSALKRSPT